jgi:hypothetical protein
MSKKTIQQIVDDLPPEKALKGIASVVKRLFPVLDERARLEFFIDLIGDVQTDKVSSLVHL